MNLYDFFLLSYLQALCLTVIFEESQGNLQANDDLSNKEAESVPKLDKKHLIYLQNIGIIENESDLLEFIQRCFTSDPFKFPVIFLLNA